MQICHPLVWNFHLTSLIHIFLRNLDSSLSLCKQIFTLHVMLSSLRFFLWLTSLYLRWNGKTPLKIKEKLITDVWVLSPVLLFTCRLCKKWALAREICQPRNNCTYLNKKLNIFCKFRWMRFQPNLAGIWDYRVPSTLQTIPGYRMYRYTESLKETTLKRKKKEFNP